MFSLNFAGLFGKSRSRQRVRRMPVTKRCTEPQAVLRMECLEDRLLLAVAVNLGTAESFAVLGASTVTNTGTTIVTGNLGVSAGSAITGFFGTLMNEGPGVVVDGTIHESDAVASLAQGAVTAAYNDLAGRPYFSERYRASSALAPRRASFRSIVSIYLVSFLLPGSCWRGHRDHWRPFI